MTTSNLTFAQYLHNRNVSVMDTDVVVDWENEVVTFLLYSPDYRLVGFQVHEWKSPKLKENTGRYHYYITHGESPVFGIEHPPTDPKTPTLVVEGCFDALALRRLGYRVLSPLTVRPRKSVQKWLKEQPNTLAICDGDSAGAYLATMCSDHLSLPEGEDPSSLDLNTLQELIEEHLCQSSMWQ